MYGAGQLDQQITFYRSRLNADGMGGFESNDAPIYQCWAKVKRTGAHEAFTAQSTGRVINCTFVIRYTDKIKEYDYIQYNGMKFNIVGMPTLDVRGNFLEIAAEIIE